MAMMTYPACHFPNYPVFLAYLEPELGHLLSAARFLNDKDLLAEAEDYIAEMNAALSGEDYD